MDIFMAGLSAYAFAAALAITLFSGFVKGAVGFAMPMIMISAFSSFLPPEIALAGLMLPTLTANFAQAFRQGWREAVQSAIAYRRFLIATTIFIPISAQFVQVIPQDLFHVLLGVPIVAFAGLQLAGIPLALKLEHRVRAEWVLGVIGGLYGGLSGVWGPPLLVYLLSVKAEKRESIRVQGVVYLIGSMVLISAHLHTGVLNRVTLPFSFALVLPAVAGLALGYFVQDRLDQARFRRWTQVLLVVSGANLVRRALGF